MKFVIDMNLSPEWAIQLARHGHSAVPWQDVGNASSPDRDIVAWSVREQHIIFTADLDFAAIIVASKAAQPSVVQLRTESTNPTRIGDIVMHAIDAAAPKLSAGAILTIDPGRTRLRLLPSPNSANE